MRIGEYELESPLMNAGGVVKSVEDVRIMAETGVGAVLAGSFTLEPREGNSPNGEIVYYHSPETGATYNALGMPNKGLEAVSKDLPEMIRITHEYGKPFILNLAPVSFDPVNEIKDMSEVLVRAEIEGIDAIELNGSCPNVVSDDGGRHAILSHNPDLLAEVLHELSDISVNRLSVGSLIVRISPFLKEEDALILAHQLKETGVDVVSAFNTFSGGKPLDIRGYPILEVPRGEGGQSGALTAQEAEAQTEWLVAARVAAGANFEIIGSNGVTDALSMKKRLDIGAAAVSATTLFYESSSWGSAVNRVLSDFIEL